MDISEGQSLVPAFEYVEDVQTWSVPYGNTEPDTPAPVSGGPTLDDDFFTGHGNNIANGHAEVNISHVTWTSSNEAHGRQEGKAGRDHEQSLGQESRRLVW